jgi:peptidoglycan/xylan/chitin deacetylase (PgdA/CDA1 family)
MSAGLSTALYFAAAVLVVPFLVGLLVLFACGKKKEVAGPVGLLFHTISGKWEPHCSYFPPKRFYGILNELSKQGFSSRTVGSASGPLQPPPSDTRRDVFLTFDDGFESFYTEALPLLSRFGFVATVFPVAGFLGKLSSWDALPGHAHMAPAQIREISDLGHEIGSHTYSHANLTLLNDNDCMSELVRSKEVLEDITGKRVTSLSFPFGRWNMRIWGKAKQAGYTHATAYVDKDPQISGIVRLVGVYSFDTVQDVLERAFIRPLFSLATARGRLMPHFAKGSPLWKFRKNYALLR